MQVLVSASRLPQQQWPLNVTSSSSSECLQSIVELSFQSYNPLFSSCWSMYDREQLLHECAHAIVHVPRYASLFVRCTPLCAICTVHHHT